MKFRIQSTGEVFDDYEDAIDYCIVEDYHEDDSYFEEWVNNQYESAYICGVTYHPYDILEMADDGNMRDVRYEFMECLNEEDRENARCELRRADIGDEIEVHYETIEVIEDDEVEDEEQKYSEESIELTRNFIAEQKLLNEQKNDIESKEDEDFMKFFQVI